MSHLIWIYAVCKSILLSSVAVKELNRLISRPSYEEVPVQMDILMWNSDFQYLHSIFRQLKGSGYFFKEGNSVKINLPPF